MAEAQMPGAAIAVVSGDRVVSSAATLPSRFHVVTLDQLLSHRAGLIDRLSEAKPRDTDFFTDPDRIFSYSSLGFSVAGQTVAATRGTTFENLLHSLLFAKIGMSATSYDETSVQPARGYRLRRGKLSPAPLLSNVQLRPAGLLYSNVDDLSRFAIAFMNGGVPPAVVAEISRTHATIPGEERRYGYGAFLSEECGVAVVSHAGDEPGGSSYLKMLPEKKLAVVVLTNLLGRLPRAMATAFRLAGGIEAADDEKKAWTKLGPTDIADLTGNYGVFLVKKKGDSVALTPKLPWFAAFLDVGREIVKFGPDRFGCIRDEKGAEPKNLTAVRGSDGKIEYLFFSGRAFKRRS
jgi:hypothetical protein